MKQVVAILFFFTCSSSSCSKKDIDLMPASVAKKYYYLALGDSYTIGEMVPAPGNFPNQVSGMMKNDSADFQSPRIIARTGWTTDELETGIIAANSANPLRSSYDFVSLLIGVNNQYRGRAVDNYRAEFEELLRKAIHYAGDRADRVVVLSIPDWGVTPFADGRDRAQIAREIDAYNAASKEITLRYNVHYIDITGWTREAATDLSLLAGDGLHPSEKEYKRWAEKIAAFFKLKI
ncbi:MAG: SGNH/GDSL hydrolase family protein [Ferruginibacter sp.]|nr:SGNH/GDSL hydrolase family protein [Chitinophagaceae bacterium]